MEFVDSRVIRVKAGDGGAGMVSFRAARHLPKAGVDGGDGGDGGHVYLIGDKRLNTLSRFLYNKLYKAEDGLPGGTNGKTGKCGDDLYLEVPLGTIALNSETGQVMAEVVGDGSRVRLAMGGRRGLGNMRFVSSRSQAPYRNTQGTEGEEFQINLELKVVADIGLAGLPNAGKSTLLSRISNARPKIADYPFTTLIPHLGVVDLTHIVADFGASYVVCDVPGLIEGANEGTGLGHEFLRHLERNKCIAYVIDPYNTWERSPEECFRMLREEIKSFSPALYEKPGIVVFTKADLISPEDELDLEFDTDGFETVRISSHTGEGIDHLLRRFYELIREANHRITEELLESAEGESHWLSATKDYTFVSKSERNARLGFGVR